MASEQAREREDVGERLRALSRHQGRITAVALGCSIAAILLAFLLPPTYESAATILIEQQEIPQELVRSTITSFADQRVQVISQRVMTSQNLLEIIDRYGLYPDIRKSKPREVLLKRMRKDVQMQMVSADVIDPRSGRPTRANIAFTVSYDSRSPDLAFKVASELTTLYLNENTSSRTKQAQQAASFLKEEAERLSKDMASIDAQIAAFKSKHSESLPELEQLNLNGLERTEAELRDVQNRLGTLNQQRLLMEAQLAQINPASTIFSDTGQRILSPEDRLKAVRSQLASARARYSETHPEVLAAEREVAGLEGQVASDIDRNDLSRQLSDLRGQLAAAQERYAPEHPEVRRLQRQISGLEQAEAAAPQSTPRPSTKPDNPAYIQVKGQLDALAAERDTLVKKEADLRSKLGDYEGRLATAPEVERTYHALVRDAEAARLKYQEVRAKQTEAEVYENLETERKGERFTLIDPPLPPEQPVSPRRWLILIMGLVFSVFAGIGAGWAKEASVGAVRGPQDLRNLLSVPPLAAVPAIVTVDDLARRRRWRLMFAGIGVTATACAVLVFHFLVMPLDIFFEILSRRFGS